MDYLLELGIRRKTVDILNSNLLDIEKQELVFLEDRVTESIIYLMQIGIKIEAIDDILLEDYHILIPGKDKLQKAIGKHGGDSFVRMINENSDYMNYLRDFK